jgi:hypothetical protein
LPILEEKRKEGEEDRRYMSKNDLTKAELRQLIDTIVFFQLGARTKELKTIKVKLKNQLKEIESK